MQNPRIHNKYISKCFFPSFQLSTFKECFSGFFSRLPRCFQCRSENDTYTTLWAGQSKYKLFLLSIKHITLYRIRVRYFYTKFFKTDQRFLSMSSYRQAYVLATDSIPNTTRKVCYGKNRKENASLLRTMEVLNEQAEICKRRHRVE